LFRSRYKGFLFDIVKYFWDYPQIPLYDEKMYKKKYVDHINEVSEYFKGRENLMQLNIALKDDFIRLCDFLKIETEIKGFPWENKT
ncbi:MAG: hypothetical protein C0490_26330, partial [Marivirga sp.]|nr:hypothetical protein [Marivirga sp.]